MMTAYTYTTRAESLREVLGAREEDATGAKVNAMYEAFQGERLRWLIGKGDLLVQKGGLDKARFAKLLERTVKEEFERCYVSHVLAGGPSTVTEIASNTSMEKHVTLHTLLALMKWGKVDIVSVRESEYVYALRET